MLSNNEVRHYTRTRAVPADAEDRVKILKNFSMVPNFYRWYTNKYYVGLMLVVSTLSIILIVASMFTGDIPFKENAIHLIVPTFVLIETILARRWAISMQDYKNKLQTAVENSGHN